MRRSLQVLHVSDWKLLQQCPPALSDHPQDRRSVPKPSDIEIVIAGCDLITGKIAKSPILALIAPRDFTEWVVTEGLLECLEIPTLRGLVLPKASIFARMS